PWPPSSASSGYRTRLETHWVRPHDALVHALHAHVSRGHSGALAARRRGWPALAVGCLDDDGHPGSAPEPASLRAAVELTLGIVRHLDREVLAPPAPQPSRRHAIMQRIPRRRGAPR
ncbi:MAG: hypothetical protein H0X56_08200, partial [Solirubrobacterales bacterium]|nr:hypothetical protein [Solirubrobacterales bacterium]